MADKIAGTHLEESLGDPGSGGTLQQVLEQAAAETDVAELVAHADVEDVRLARAQAHDAITDDLPRQIERAAGVPDAQAVAEDVLAPRKRVTVLLDGRDLGQVDLHHRPDMHLRHLAQVLGRRGH